MRRNARRLKIAIPVVIALCATTVACVAADQDASIDRLLKKLPPPEKLVKRPVQSNLATDPAARDPIMQKVLAALRAEDLSEALSGSRRLARKYSTNATVHALHGIIAFSARQMPEASGAFRTAVQLNPQLSLGYAGLGSAEAARGNFASGLTAFQELTRREPAADVGWIGSSTCAQALGRREQSLQYARRATTVAPKSPAAWLQLARAENALGHADNARRALARARQLGGTSAGNTRR